MKRRSFHLQYSSNLHFCVVILSSVLPFLKTLKAEFVFDDRAAIVTNPDVLGDSSLLDLISHDFWGNDILLPGSHKSWRPLTTLTFRWTHSLFGLSTFAFHGGNVLIHCLVSCLVLLFSKRIGLSPQTSLAASLFFSVHPVHCEAVAGVVGRADLLSTFFVLLGILYHKSFEDPIGTILLSLLAMFSKESGLMLLPICVFYSLMLKRKSSRTLLSLTFSFFFISWMRISFSGTPSFSPSDNPLVHEKDWLTRVFTLLYLPVFHLFLLFFPKELCFDWSMGAIPLLSSFSDRRLWLSLSIYSLSSSFVIFLLRRRTCWLELFCFSFSIISFLPASNIFFPVGFLAAERILYLPSVGFCLFAARFLEKFSEKLNISFSHISFLIFCLLTTRTLTRNEDWMTSETLYSSAVHLNPPKAWANLGQTLASKGNLMEAAAAYDQALRHRANMADTWYNLGVLQSDLGNHSLAVTSYSTAIGIRKAFAAAHLNLGVTLLRQGRKDEAEKVLTRCLEIDGKELKNWKTHVEAQIGCRIQRGRLRMKEKRWKEAREDFTQILRRQEPSENSLVIRSLAEIEVNLNHMDLAEAMLRKLLEDGRKDKASVLQLAKIFLMQNKINEAEDLLRRAIDSLDECVECLSQLGLLIADWNPKESEEFLRKASFIHPNRINLLNYGVILHKNGNLEEAEEIYRRVLEMEGTDDLARDNLKKLLRAKRNPVKRL